MMEKTHQDHGHSISNGLLNFGNNFCHAYKTHEYGLLSYNVGPMYLKLCDLDLILFKKLKMHWMNGIWF